MKISELFNQKTVMSYEIFPPKRSDPIYSVYDTIDRLKDLNPDYISVTYGAGGSMNNQDMIKIAADLKNRLSIESVAHLPCLNISRDDVRNIIRMLHAAEIDNILVLRGDRNKEIRPKRDFKHASDLAAFIRKTGDFNLIGACYPEGHIESRSRAEDIDNLKIKIDSGVSQLITQAFFDNRHFYKFREQALIAGIDVPIQAGIMPVVNSQNIKRLLSLSGVELPKKFKLMIDKYANNAEAMREAGIAYAIDQIVDLIAQGVVGIHLYTMNKPYIAYCINKAIKSLLAA